MRKLTAHKQLRKRGGCAKPLQLKFNAQIIFLVRVGFCRCLQMPRSLCPDDRSHLAQKRCDRCSPRSDIHITSMFHGLCDPLQKSPRGGWRQQMGAASHRNCGSSSLALQCLLDWGDGVLSARKLVWYMQAALADDVALGRSSHPMIARLAAVASTSHANTSGCAKALISLLIRRCDIDTAIVRLPQRRESLASHITSPKLLLETLNTLYPDKFKTVLGIDENTLECFWPRFLQPVTLLLLCKRARNSVELDLEGGDTWYR